MKWIKIEDKTPEEGEEVQIYYYHELYQEHGVSSAFWEQGYWNDTCRIKDFDSDWVTHWKPLSKAPKT